MKYKIFFLVFIIAIATSCKGKVDKNINQLGIAMSDSMFTYEISNAGGYESIDLMYSDSLGLPDLYRTAAMELKMRTDEMVNFIRDLKVVLVIEADGPNSTALAGYEIIISRVEHPNNTTVPREILIGKNNDLRAYDLQAILSSYRSFLADLAKDQPAVIEKINSVIDLSNVKSPKPGEADITWVDHNFRKKNITEVLIVLSRLQIDLRSLESEIISLIKDQLDELASPSSGNN